MLSQFAVPVESQNHGRVVVKEKAPKVVKCRKCGDMTVLVVLKVCEASCVCDVCAGALTPPEEVFRCPHEECGWDICIPCTDKKARAEALPHVNIFDAPKPAIERERETPRQTKARELGESRRRQVEEELAAQTRELPPFIKQKDVVEGTVSRQYIIDEDESDYQVHCVLGGEKTAFMQNGNGIILYPAMRKKLTNGNWMTTCRLQRVFLKKDRGLLPACFRSDKQEFVVQWNGVVCDDGVRGEPKCYITPWEHMNKKKNGVSAFCIECDPDELSSAQPYLSPRREADAHLVAHTKEVFTTYVTERLAIAARLRAARKLRAAGPSLSLGCFLRIF